MEINEGMRRLSAFSPPDGQIIHTQSSNEGGDNGGSRFNNELTFNNNNRELLNIAVEIGDGHSANILIRERDDPSQVSFDFARKYGLSEQLREILEE